MTRPASGRDPARTQPEKGSVAERPKRLLLLSYHFPPSEAPGALRWQKLTAIGARRGWVVEAIALDPDQAGRTDPRRLADLPAGTIVHRVGYSPPWEEVANERLIGIWQRIRPRRSAAPSQSLPAATERPPVRVATIPKDETTWFAKGRGIVRAFNAWLSHADERAWCRQAYRAGLQAGRAAKPDVIVSCGPPHLVHETARKLARSLGVPFVMDMRDPWAIQKRLLEEVASPLWYWLASRYESRCVAAADLVVMNTQVAERAMKAQWPTATIMSALNGWDDDPLPSADWPSQFRVVYAGTIYLDRSPRSWFQAVARTIRELGVGPNEFEVRLIGAVDTHGQQSVKQLAEDEGVGPFVRIMPPMPRQAVQDEYAEAAVLLSLPQDSYTAIPSKVFEYLRQPCWVLAQTERESATGMILDGTTACVLPPEDVEGTAAFLVRCFRDFKAGRRPAPIALNGKWSRATEGAKLFDALDRIAARRAP